MHCSSQCVLDEAAHVIRTWAGQRTRDIVKEELDRLPDDDRLWRAVDDITTAATSDDEMTRKAGLNTLFSKVVEPLNDSFLPVSREVYARVFSRIVWRVAELCQDMLQALEDYGISDQKLLYERYQRVRTHAHLPEGPIRRVVVLSRVTFGADISLTSVVLQRLQQRFPSAKLILLGGGNLHGLFGGFHNVRVHELTYVRRGSLLDRIRCWLQVRDAIREETPDLVVGPDSRLDQLGLLPTCPEDRYLLWENLQPDGEFPRSLVELLDSWLVRVLNLPPTPAVMSRVMLNSTILKMAASLRDALGSRPTIAVKLDYGGDERKSLPRHLEVAILQAIRQKRWRVILCAGCNAKEWEHSDSLLKDLNWLVQEVSQSKEHGMNAIESLAPGQLAGQEVIRFHGLIGWAAVLSCSQHAFSYDSVAQHLAAALGVPVTVAFTGYEHPTFPIAWKPCGPGQVTQVTIPTEEKNSPASLAAILSSIPTAPYPHM